MGYGKSLELFFVNGQPDEMLTARVFNWTGHVLKTPRTQIKDALARPEAAFTGVYLLLGQLDGEPRAYVGESECLSDRIKAHDLNKDWWETAILITTTANELNKAHIKYLESRLIQKALAAKAAGLDNGTTPPTAKLSEASVSNMEEFLDVIGLVLPAIGVDLLENKAAPLAAQVSPGLSGAVSFTLVNRKHGIEAHAKLIDGSFVVVRGSQARGSWEAKTAAPYHSGHLHQKLVEDGVLQPSGRIAVFAKDYKFDCPSAAAAICNGRAANGRVEWKHDASGLTYAAWEEAELKGALT